MGAVAKMCKEKIIKMIPAGKPAGISLHEKFIILYVYTKNTGKSGNTKRKELKKMDKNYEPSERQKKCKNSFPYMGKEMNKTYCRKLMQERRDADEDDMSVCVSNEQCENCPDYESRFIEYPIQVNSIKCDKMKQLMMGRAGSLVKIRPCNKEYGDKTYLGLYLGNQPWSQTVSYNKELGELTVGVATNPAIYVFDLQRIIFGAESWWGIIESLEELKDITDDDINNIWYVKALKAMHKDEPEETTEEKLKRISEAVKEHPENFEMANKIRLGRYYAFVKPFDVTFENDERVQVSEGCVCKIKNDGNVIFKGSGAEMPERAVEYIKKNAAKYLVDVTKLF